MPTRTEWEGDDIVTASKTLFNCNFHCQYFNDQRHKKMFRLIWHDGENETLTLNVISLYNLLNDKPVLLSNQSKILVWIAIWSIITPLNDAS